MSNLEHRKQRLSKLLSRLGDILNFGTHGTENEVIWEANNEVGISFRITDEKILVEASRTTPEEKITSELGSISYEALENALLRWCQKYRQQGVSGLEDRRQGGNRAMLTTEQIQEVRERLHAYTPRALLGLQAATLDGQFWTVEDLQQVV